MASAEWYDFGSDILTFFPKTCCIFGSLCRMAKSFGVSPMKIQPFFVCLICKTLRFGWYCLSSLMILIGVLNFGSIPVAQYLVISVVLVDFGIIQRQDDLGSVYTGPDPFGTGTKLVRISLVFTRDLADPVWFGSAIWY